MGAAPWWEQPHVWIPSYTLCTPLLLLPHGINHCATAAQGPLSIRISSFEFLCQSHEIKLTSFLPKLPRVWHFPYMSIYVVRSVRAHVTQSRDQRTAWERQCSPSTVWVLGTKPSGLGIWCLCLLAHPISPWCFIMNNTKRTERGSLWDIFLTPCDPTLNTVPHLNAVLLTAMGQFGAWENKCWLLRRKLWARCGSEKATSKTSLLTVSRVCLHLRWANERNSRSRRKNNSKAMVWKQEPQRQKAP